METDNQRRFAALLRVANRSKSDDLTSNDIIIETRVQDLYVLNNYLPNIQHLAGVIELDVIDSLKIICRKLERTEKGIDLAKH